MLTGMTRAPTLATQHRLNWDRALPMPDVNAISSYGPTTPITGAHLHEWFEYLEIDPTHQFFAGLNNSGPADDFQQSVVRTKLALCEDAVNDLHGLELGDGHMTGGL